MHTESYQDYTSNTSNSAYSRKYSSNNFSDYINRKRKRGANLNNFSSKEEERILKYALKLSEKEYQAKKQEGTNQAEICSKYSDIPTCSTFEPTEEDFKNPISYFDTLWKESENDTGLIKIVPPPSWKEKQKKYFNNEILTKIESNDKPLTTRKQTLGLLYQAKKFDHVREFNYEQYKSYCTKIFSEVFHEMDEKKITIEDIEEKYWNLCKEGSENITIHYAADISMQKYYTKSEFKEKLDSVYFLNSNASLSSKEVSSPSLNNIQEVSNQKKKKDLSDKGASNLNGNNETKESFSLLTANISKNSLMQFIKGDSQKQISGITIPWYYFGMLFSTFCWHTEDLYLYSLNYLHDGKPKIWYGISSKDKEKMDDFIKNKYFAILIKKPDLIHSLTVHIDPKELKAAGINVFRVVQNPGEIILTLPKAYHTGFSTGINMAEAVNLSSLKWIDFGFQAQKEYIKSKRKSPVFPMEWLIMQNYQNTDLCKFDDKNYKHKIRACVNHIISSEIDNRILIENFFDINNINYIIEELDYNDDSEIFDCNICTNIGFLSQLICKNCKKKSCISHSIQCKCLPTDFILRIRYLTKELEKIRLIKKCSKNQSGL